MNYRKVWFITRPERDPKFHKEALEALAEATDNFNIIWRGNREAHRKYEEILAQKGIKRDSVSSDGSGGRTWAAMLRTFCYCYLNDEQKLVLTKVGQKLIAGIKVFENIKKQILTLQIPNAYFLESGFKPKFDPEFEIRPVRFLIKLCCLEKLDFYLTKEEITFFAMTAKKDSQLYETAEKIIQFRQSSDDKREEIKKEIAEKLDHRQRTDRAARDFEAAHSDVAHTFMLIAEYTGLVEYIRGQALRVNSGELEKVKKELEYYDNRYPFNTRYLISLQRMAENNGLDIDSYKASSFGAVKPMSNREKSLNKAERLLKEHPEPSELSSDEIISILSREFPKREAEKIAGKILTELEYSSLSEEFIESYLNVKNSQEFEVKTAEILEAFGFEVEMRPSHGGNEKTEIEILVKYGKDKCGIIDAKNYKDKFQLSASLASHMALEYIRLYSNYEGRNIEFFGYIAANDISGARNLKKISELAQEHVINRNISGFMINAKTLLSLLDYCIENRIPKKDRMKLFLSLIDNSIYTDFYAVRKKLNI
ncbi:MAG: restriction endonuclease [Thermosipho sp. (in: Bacteria)]|nr:restriction endonuclease [Thermosipho sp. (in: thermotogales)]